MNKNAHVKTVKLKDINEKELLYVTIETENGRKSIHIGQKNFDEISNLISVGAQPEKPKEKK